MPRGLLVAAALLVPTSALPGQSAVWAAYGHNSDQATGLTTGENVSIGYMLTRGTAGAAAALGVPVDATVSSRWGTIAGWFDQPVAATRWRASGGGSAFAFDDRIIDGAGAGSTLWLEAERPVRVAPLDLRLRASARHGWRTRAGESSSRLLGRAGVASGVRAGPLAVWAVVDHWLADESGYTQVGGRVGLYEPQYQLWGSFAHWLDDDLPGTGWDVGGRLSVSDRVSVIARGGVQAADILFWIPPQRTWSVGLQLRTGGSPAMALVPVPVLRDGRRAITLTLPDGRLADAPAVAGTFSEWRPLTMRRGDDGWEIDVVLEPGVHEYSFRTADGEWFVPEGTPGRKPDGFGGHVAVVIVE